MSQFNDGGRVTGSETDTLTIANVTTNDAGVYQVTATNAFGGTNSDPATLTVVGRETISVHAGSYRAIKIDLHLNKVGKNLELEPHKKFRRATLWVSDDSDRILLRIEAQIFVGTVFAELQSVEFDNPKSGSGL